MNQNNARLAAGIGMLLGAPICGADPGFDCVMNPSKVVQVATATSGILEEVLVGRGDIVARNQPVARLISDLAKADVEVTRLQASNQTAIATAEATVDQTRGEFNRLDRLIQTEAISVSLHEEAKARLRIAESALAQAKIEHQLAGLVHARTTSELNLRTIRSPIDGLIVNVAHSAGEFLRQDGFVVVVASTDPLHVETSLPVALFPDVSVGMTARVRPDPPANGVYSAKVTVVDQIFDAASGSFGVRLVLPNPSRGLPAGHRCKVEFSSSDSTSPKAGRPEEPAAP